MSKKSKTNKMDSSLKNPDSHVKIGSLSSEDIELVLSNMDTDLQATVILSALAGTKERFLEAFASACDAMYFRKMSTAIAEAEAIMDHEKNQAKRFAAAQLTKDLIIKGRGEGYLV